MSQVCLSQGSKAKEKLQGVSNIKHNRFGPRGPSSIVLALPDGFTSQAGRQGLPALTPQTSPLGCAQSWSHPGRSSGLKRCPVPAASGSDTPTRHRHSCMCSSWSICLLTSAFVQAPAKLCGCETPSYTALRLPWVCAAMLGFELRSLSQG